MNKRACSFCDHEQQLSLIPNNSPFLPKMFMKIYVGGSLFVSCILVVGPFFLLFIGRTQVSPLIYLLEGYVSPRKVLTLILGDSHFSLGALFSFIFV